MIGRSMADMSLRRSFVGITADPVIFILLFQFFQFRIAVTAYG